MAARSQTNRGPAAAAENRRALIDAARELFAERGFAVPFSQIARRAGVGQASLYRHFANKHALAIAVFDENLANLERDAHDLRGFLELIVAQARMSASLLEVLDRDDDPAVAALEDRLRHVIAAILAHERGRGRIDPAIEVDDVATAVSMIALHAAFLAEGRGADTTRAVALIERALAPRS